MDSFHPRHSQQYFEPNYFFDPPHQNFMPMPPTPKFNLCHPWNHAPTLTTPPILLWKLVVTHETGLRVHIINNTLLKIFVLNNHEVYIFFFKWTAMLLLLDRFSKYQIILVNTLFFFFISISQILLLCKLTHSKEQAVLVDICLISELFHSCIWYEYCNGFTKIFLQKLYIMYTKIVQSTKFVYILYTKIVQIKILYDNVWNVQKSYIPFLHIHKKFTKCTELVQSLDQKRLETWNVCFLYIQTLFKLYKTYTTS